MRNWDEGEEVGNQNCSVEADARDAAAVCRQLGLPLVEADFVSQYWTQVRESSSSWLILLASLPVSLLSCVRQHWTQVGELDGLLAFPWLRLLLCG